MKKNKSLYTLFRLYLSYHLNKTFLIIFALLLVLWCFVLILNTGYPLEEEIYSIEATSYHFNYKEQSIFFLQIIDSVLISLLIGNEIHSLALFDSMFVPNTSRIRLIIVKILVNLFILALLLIWQIFFLELIGLLIFPKFIVTIESFKLIFYVLLPMIELLLLGEFISLVFNSYFISILIFILGIVMNILLKVEAISKTLYYFIPKIIVQTKEIIIIGNIPIYLGICFLLVLASILMFQKKDISY